MNKKLLAALIQITPFALFAIIAAYSLSFHAYSSDEYAYLTTGKAFAENTLAGYTDLGRFPLYSFTLSLLFRVFGYGELIARVFSIALGLAGIFLTHKLAKQLFDEETASWSALIVATNPIYIYLTTRMLSEPLFLVLFLASIIVLYNAKNWKHFLAFGALTGLTFLTRYFGAYLLLIAFLYIHFYKKKLVSWKNTTAATIGVIAALFPWMAWSQSETGSAFGFALQFFSNQLALNEASFSLPDKIPFYFIGVLMILGAASILLINFLKIKQKEEKTGLLLTTIIGVWIPLEVYGLLGNAPLLRYVVPIAPILAILGVQLLSTNQNELLKKALYAAIALNLIIGFAAITYFGNNAKYIGYREAGLFAAAHCASVDSNIQRIVEHYSGKRNAINGECIVSSAYDGKLEIPPNYSLVFQNNGASVYKK